MSLTQGMTAKKLLGYYQNKADQDAREAKARGDLVCWSASVAPSEFCVTMGIAMIYPETHAAGIGARKGAIDMLDVAARKGYNIDCCSYGRVNMGYMECLKETAITGKKPDVLVNSPAADVPLPDLVITCNNICNTLLKWYENLAVELDIPCIVIDVPFNHTMPIPEYAKAYIADQFRNAISQLEVICGRPFDWKKFKEVKDQTQRSVYHWNRIADMAQYKPSPLNGFDLFNYMALIVACRSLDYAEITFKKFADELEGDEKTGANIILKALEAPLYQIAKNAGLEGAVIVNKVRESEPGTGFDAYNEKYVNMVEKGILDPAKVTRSALQNATSVASTLLTTESVVATIKEDAPAMPAGGAGGMGMM